MDLALTPRTDAKTNVPWHLWVVAGLTLSWHVWAGLRFLAATTDLFGRAFPVSSELALFSSFPPLVIGFWAIGVWGGLLGSLFLVARSRWAVQAFVMALVSLMGVSIWLFALSDHAANIYAMPVALTTWFVTLTTLLYSTRWVGEDTLS